ncbi:hypothetical protein HY500_03275 [Candidatus Woesearchaeota archaeon]|nr:hypothetical protein [Candidatus Woesearchaeota archaeon]
MKINTKSLIYATSLTIILATLLTIIAELSKLLKDFLASITGHHWVTKGLFALIIFIAVYFFFASSKDYKECKKEIYSVIAITIVSSLAIFLFFVWHFLSK